MFDPEKIYKQAAIAKIAGVSTRTLANWRDRDLLPDPDAILGNRFPAWWGSTLNKSRAFAKPEQARTA
ncbi:MAG: hypothetical protein IT485_01850 [Gammaproteobacteria bacterium]|nr:hypothetical protein [Gammaproteobacteria bacterium]